MDKVLLTSRFLINKTIEVNNIMSEFDLKEQWDYGAEEQKIENQRLANKDNPSYPIIHWCTDSLLTIRIKDEEYTMSPMEAIDNFHDNELFMNELHFLLSAKNNNNNLIKRYKKIKSKEEKVEEIEKKIQDIIMELGLKESVSGSFSSLRACCKVQEYIIKHNIYTSDILDKKANGNFDVIDDLYAAVVENKSICTSNSLEFKAILSKIGLDVEVVAIEGHASNIVKLGDSYYFFDSTLEQSFFLQNANDDQDYILCCAGLGMQEYSSVYSPIGIFKEEQLSLLPLPENIAQYRIPFKVIGYAMEENTKDDFERKL